MKFFTNNKKMFFLNDDNYYHGSKHVLYIHAVDVTGEKEDTYGM